MITSFVFSCFNEQENAFLFKNLELLSKELLNEVIVVDGGSKDLTVSRISSYSRVKIFNLPNSNRAERYNFGLGKASGSVLTVVHPRTLLPDDVSQIVRELTFEDGHFYAFTHCFDERNLLLRFTSWYSNRIRGDLRGIYYLDHCWILNRALIENLEQPLIPPVDIFEDSLFCLKLKKRGATAQRLKAVAITSAIRFRKNGLLRQSLLNQKLKLQFLFSFRPKTMNRNYEKNLNLN